MPKTIQAKVFAIGLAKKFVQLVNLLFNKVLCENEKCLLVLLKTEHYNNTTDKISQSPGHWETSKSTSRTQGTLILFTKSDNLRESPTKVTVHFLTNSQVCSETSLPSEANASLRICLAAVSLYSPAYYETREECIEKIMHSPDFCLHAFFNWSIVAPQCC